MVYRMVYGVQATVVYGVQAGVWCIGWCMVYRMVYGV